MTRFLGFAAVLFSLLVACAPGGTGGTPTTPTETRPASATVVEQACSDAFDISPTEAPARFAIDGNVAVMRGVIDSSTPNRVETLIQDNPDVHTIVMAYVPGSDDDDANLEASLSVHDALLATCVPRSGEIASGGTDFFLAGVVRRLADDTFVGVHSWAGEGGLEGRDLPRSDPEHDPYLAYYRQIGIDPDFYWFTLDAAPSDGMHNMSDSERERWGMETP